MKSEDTGVLGEAICEVKPFKYVLFPEVKFNINQVEKALDWLDRRAQWRRETTSFYDQYELLISPDHVDEAIRFLVNPLVLRDVKDRLEELLGVELYNFVRIGTHMLVPGQKIGIHTDKSGLLEGSHRLLIQLNRRWEDTYGGHLVLLTGMTTEDIHRILRPINRSAFAFEFGEKSYHCVVKVKDGKRYTLVYDFWCKPAQNHIQCSEIIKKNNTNLFVIS